MELCLTMVVDTRTYTQIKTIQNLPWTVWLGRLECRPVHQIVVGFFGSPVRTPMGGNPLMFLSHIDVSLSISLSFPLPVSLKAINVSSGRTD